MLFPEAQSQVSFLKDLVTQRDPTSKFSFLNFLHSTKRLDNFVNLQTFNPYRMEISNYLQWVANNLKKTEVVYNSKVTSVSPEISTEGNIVVWCVTVDNGNVYHASRLIFGAGRDHNIPAVFEHVSEDKLIHSANFLTTLAKKDRTRVKNIAVIGGAQSSVEMYQFCIDSFHDANADHILRQMGTACIFSGY